MTVGPKKNGGQMIIEVILAIGVISIVLVGMSDLISRTSRASRLQADRAQAKKLVESLVASLRQARDTDAETFFVTPFYFDASQTRRDVDAACSWPITAPASITCSMTKTAIGTEGYEFKITASWTENSSSTNTLVYSVQIMKKQ